MKKAIIFSLFIILMCYLVSSLAAGTFDIALWSETVRAGLLKCATFSLFVFNILWAANGGWDND